MLSEKKNENAITAAEDAPVGAVVNESVPRVVDMDAIIRESFKSQIKKAGNDSFSVGPDAGQEACGTAKIDAGRTVRSGFAYDFDSTEPVRADDAERAAGIKEMVGDEPLKGPNGRFGYLFIKRVFDFCFSASVLIALSWLFLILAIIIKVDDPKGPVFFKQQRVGKDGKVFYMYKFRSMCVDAEARLA